MYSGNLQIYLMLIRLLVPILILEELKPASPTLSVILSLTSLIISYSNVVFISMPILLPLASWTIHHWHLCYFLISLYNDWNLWFLYQHLRPLCLSLNDLTLLSWVLWYSCKHQKFWALATLNSVFALQTFRPTLQNLQRLLTFPMSLSSITNLPTFLAKPKLKYSLLIILIISKSIWKKVLNLWLALYTLLQYLNKKLQRNSSRKTSTQVSSDQSPLHIVYWSYLSRRKMVYCTYMSTYVALTAFPKRISLPLISNLLDSPYKAQVYSKIDFCHVYHLVCITNGDEWKTTFRIYYGSFE